ncbi:MAG: type 4a pilus biogenesis protein PilO [Candidatus Omnitrophica bacterium]|nr:type 4a pilus biogenesis protein PilO [Candidatus Omnitrophota bacterium]
MLYVKLSKREKYIFTATAIFIAMILLYNFIFEPGFKKWQLINTEIEAKKARINKGIRLLESRNSIIEEYNKYAKSTKNISKLLNYMENLADSLDIKTSNIKPGQAMDKEFSREYSVELQIEGQLQDIIKFLSELIKLPTMVVLKKFDFRLISQNPPIFKGTIIFSKILI